jgi:hypothetical protein
LVDAGVKPGQRIWDIQCEEWVCNLECLIDDSLRKTNIIGGFVRSGIYPLDRELVTANLPSTYPPFLSSSKKTSLYSIGNKVVTDPLFLQSWENDILEKINIKKKKGGGNVGNIKLKKKI